jgi:hypothetical protein
MVILNLKNYVKSDDYDEGSVVTMSHMSLVSKLDTQNKLLLTSIKPKPKIDPGFASFKYDKKKEKKDKKKNKYYNCDIEHYRDIADVYYIYDDAIEKYE